MRIISGEFGGRIIKVPKSKLVRPTTDRNKESIFSYLSNKLDFEGIKACDLYSGSGSLGLEIISRGASEVHFVEQNYKIYQNILDNISKIGVGDRSKVFKMTSLKFTNLRDHDNYNLIIADPPFFKDDIYDVWNNIINNNYLTKNGIFIIERSIQTQKEDISHFRRDPIKKLGDSLIYEFNFSNLV